MQSVVNRLAYVTGNREISRTTLILLVALWVSVLPNLATHKMFYAASETAALGAHLGFVFGGWLTVFAFVALGLALLGLPFVRGTIRYLLAIALVAAAALGYFSLFFGTLFDKTMLVNLMQTHASESVELLNLRLIVWVLVVGVLPAIWVLRVRVKPEPSLLKAVWRPAVSLVVLLALASIAVFSQYSRYASAGRNRDITFHTVAPLNIIGAAVAHAHVQRTANIVREARGTDARQGYALAKPRLVIMLVGETTRAQNWGLNGYERDTTPRLRALNVVNFPDVSSCGTATAISLPCMFSGLSREDFSLAKAAGRETLIDVISRSGARIFWRDNDGGCKGVCDRIENEDFNNSDDPAFCSAKGECVDEILLNGLEAKIRESSKDTFVVLHLKGSHGPAYYKRYPKAFERFTPVCKTSDLASCSRDEIRNAYDNTILYGDHIAAETILMLGRLSDRFATAMMYASDHGESLGESGLYLHGMPYAMAPKEQTKIPMVAWLSNQFMQLEHWDAACISNQAKLPRSHDHLYSTLLGLMEIETSEYQRSLDVFEDCDLRDRGKPGK